MSSGQRAETVAVIGAGLMGTGIAHAFATAGCAVLLVDTNARVLQKSVETIGEIISEGVRRAKITSADGERALARITAHPELAPALKASAVDLLLETAAESLEVKKAIVAVADPLLPRHALIATNTSALSVTEISTASSRPERMVGMHFFNPVHKMKLLEIVRGLQTSDDAVARSRVWADAIGKTSIVVNEAPGLTTSRMSALLGNEAMYMLLEGTATAEDIDTALRLGFNHPMGPLELGDLTGWDTRLAVLQYLHSTLGEKFRPCPLILKLVKSGRIGLKVGRGVYEYIDGSRVPESGLRLRR
jgi:3-hydroxybutyryl-CoA dehydrogenase